jgi:hypothetical protein
MRFSDKVVAITGAAQGIGRQTAEQAAAEGAAPAALWLAINFSYQKPAGVIPRSRSAVATALTIGGLSPARARRHKEAVCVLAIKWSPSPARPRALADNGDHFIAKTHTASLCRRALAGDKFLVPEARRGDPGIRRQYAF